TSSLLGRRFTQMNANLICVFCVNLRLIYLFLAVVFFLVAFFDAFLVVFFEAFFVAFFFAAFLVAFFLVAAIGRAPAFVTQLFVVSLKNNSRRRVLNPFGLK